VCHLHTEAIYNVGTVTISNNCWKFRQRQYLKLWNPYISRPRSWHVMSLKTVRLLTSDSDLWMTKWLLLVLMWFGHVRDNRSYKILSVNGACPSLVICAVPTSVKTTPELSTPAFGVLQKTGDEELEDPGKPGWKRLRMIWARSTLAWWRQDGALWIDRHGVYSWM